MILALMICLMSLPFFFAMVDGRAAIKKRNKNRAEIQNPEPKRDESGFLVKYDPHHVRALEIEMDTHPDLLTTCDNEDCGICKSNRSLNTDLTVKDELIDSVVRLAKTVEGTAEALIVNTDDEVQRLTEHLEEQERLNKVHSAEDFRPEAVPAEAIPTVSESNGKISIEWRWVESNREEKYLVRLTGYRLVDGHIRLSPLWRPTVDELKKLDTELKVQEKANKYSLKYGWEYDATESSPYTMVYAMRIQDSYGVWHNTGVRKLR